MNKLQYRNMVKQKLALIKDDTYEKMSNQIAHRLYENTYWKTAATIGITISKGKEVNTYPIIQQGWEEGKKIAVPKCYPKEKRMEFRYIHSFDQLESVYFGLKEPIVAETELCEAKEIDLMIVPGIVFDPKGYRIGYGGGYYDRYLKHFHQQTISLAFSCQIIDKIPFDDHDIPVKQIITEIGAVNCIHDGR